MQNLLDAQLLESLGLDAGQIFYNLDYDELNDHEIRNEEGCVTADGTFAVDTGVFTGRSPKDKFIVDHPDSSQNIWWGEINQKVSLDVFNTLKEKVLSHLNHGDLYVTDAFCGSDEAHRMNVRVVTEFAWQAHFCKNMFIRPEEKDLEGFAPDFTILNACKVRDEEWQEHGLNSPVFIIFNMEERLAIIGGTYYGGEMKKGIFSIMNYQLPLDGVLPMHCSANLGEDGDSALFFGLSGTGKTTLSADPNRLLIGDDEHGWGDNGIFNFEGGCYAKLINLNPLSEPEIYKALRRDALLENVVLNAKGNVDFNDGSKTENTRASYPLYHIEKTAPGSIGPHPSAVVFLTCDAFGVLPPVSKLSHEQAMYYFISGYTAKVAGTERGIKEPQAVFSPCFGGPFLTQHPLVYAKLLGQKLQEHDVPVYLVNTGWSGGPYGVGKRMDISVTRKIIDAIISGSIKDASFVVEEYFGLAIPESLEGLHSSVLDPVQSWESKEEYTEKARGLNEMFKENYQQYSE